MLKHMGRAGLVDPGMSRRQGDRLTDRPLVREMPRSPERPCPAGAACANPNAKEDARAFMRRVSAIEITNCPHCKAGRWRVIEHCPADRATLARLVPANSRGPP
jgi:hypothetical protein